MNATGIGLKGLKHASFQEYIVKDICKHYFELDPILKDRPNVTPWSTNGGSDDSIQNNKTEEIHDFSKVKRTTSVFLSSDDESSYKSTNVNMSEVDRDSDIKIIELPHTQQ